MSNSSANNYSNFSEIDFINDAFFQDWIINSTDEKEAFWNEFLKAYPKKKEEIRDAATFLKNVNFKEDVPDDDYVHQRFLEHLNQVQTKSQAKIIGLTIKTFRKIASVAAIVAAAVLIASILFFNKTAAVAKLVVTTRFGEIKKLSFPDGSSVVLNANSNITFPKIWDKNKPREIWLKGEAFFEINHLNDNKSEVKPFEKFLVHGEGFTIEVLGTSFDIRQRRGKTEVVLQTGKIKLTLKDNNSPIIMLPGDLVTYTPETQKLVTAKTIPEEYSGWKEKKLVLNNPTVQEIANYLEDNFGKRIDIQSQKIKNKKIEGIIELNNLDDALFIISTVLNTDIEKRSDRIIIKPK